MKSLQERMRLWQLFEIYGSLLTVKQREYVKSYFGDDLSLAEVAITARVTRSAVHDLLKRVEMLVERYEAKLAFLARREHAVKLIGRAHILLDETTASRQKDELQTILKGLSEALASSLPRAGKPFK